MNETNDIKALEAGDIDAGIVAGLAGMEEFRQNTVILRTVLHVYCAGKPLLPSEVARTSGLDGRTALAAG